MDSKAWRWMLPPWVVAWILLLTCGATLVIVLRCCPCRDGAGATTGSPSGDPVQPQVPLVRMKLAEPGQGTPDPRAVQTAEYDRATGAGGTGTTQTAQLSPLPIPPSLGAAAQHFPPSSEGATRSIRLRYGYEGDAGMHSSTWITPVVDGQARMIKFADAVLMPNDGHTYRVQLTLALFNLSGTAEDPTPLQMMVFLNP